MIPGSADEDTINLAHVVLIWELVHIWTRHGPNEINLTAKVRNYEITNQYLKIILRIQIPIFIRKILRLKSCERAPCP